eukprot:TRINITY_DN14308_c0_g3_i2.p1 TRINITY_DN14308_c0_g3~~TRINITY_DN14308_c0_g3_i2.p1  ORF type:complete len:731 (+),score=170.99 TRINITY_DN14308_c0_g3_i2:325-2193(+)
MERILPVEPDFSLKQYIDALYCFNSRLIESSFQRGNYTGTIKLNLPIILKIYTKLEAEMKRRAPKYPFLILASDFKFLGLQKCSESFINDDPDLFQMFQNDFPSFVHTSLNAFPNIINYLTKVKEIPRLSQIVKRRPVLKSTIRNPRLECEYRSCILKSLEIFKKTLPHDRIKFLQRLASNLRVYSVLHVTGITIQLGVKHCLKEREEIFFLDKDKEVLFVPPRNTLSHAILTQLLGFSIDCLGGILETFYPAYVEEIREEYYNTFYTELPDIDINYPPVIQTQGPSQPVHVQHLLSILPATSYLSIPRPLRPLVLPSSPIYDLFPSTFTLDLAGCNSGGGWTGGRDGVVHLPTIDEKRILEAYHNATKQFPWTQNELLRNTNNNEKLFILQSDNIAPSKEQPIESKTESDPSTEWIELSLERNGITGLVKASSVNGPCYEFKLIEMDLEDLYGGTIYTTESIDELKKDTPQNSWAMYQRTRFKKINPNTNRKRPKRKKVPQRPFTGKGYSLIGSAIGKPTDITEALFPQEKPNHTYKLPILANQLPTTKISVKAFNGKNQVIELNLTHTVGDVYEAVRYYFPEGPEFRLMVTYPRKVLRDLGETVQAAGLLNSLLVQIKSD